MRKQLIAQNLRLTETEAAKFWPVYDQYIKELIAINDKKFALIQDYADNWGTLTNDQSLLFIRQWLDADIAQTQLRQKYVPIVAKVLEGNNCYFLSIRSAYCNDARVAGRIADAAGTGSAVIATNTVKFHTLALTANVVSFSYRGIHKAHNSKNIAETQHQFLAVLSVPRILSPQFPS
jgi:hypothetical protein